MNPPPVHVLVVSWNGARHLRECFDALCSSDYPNARFVLIDNGSTDGSVALMREWYGGDWRVEVVEAGSNLGWSGGNNMGIRRAMEAGARYVLLLNNDTVCAPNAITELVRMAEDKACCGALAPKMLLYDAPYLLNSLGLECSTIGAAWDRGFGRVDGPRWRQDEPVAGGCGGALLLRVDALRQTGLLAESFGMYLDDLDLCLRLWNAGHEVWTCAAAEVRHKFSATMGHGALARRKYYLNTRNRFYVIARNYPAGRMAGVLAACVAGEVRAVGRALLDGAFWRIGAHVRAWGAALLHLPEAVRFRQDQGPARAAFWPLLRKVPAFFPGIELPHDGWYGATTWKGRELRAMSAEAGFESPGGLLRVTLVCCYPRLGPARVEVWCGERVLDVMETGDCCERVLDCPRGRLVFRARRIFEAEATGETVDLGGWLALETDFLG